MSGFGVLLRKELLEQWRTLRLPIVTVLFLLVGFGSPVLARFTPELVKALAGSQLSISLPAPQAADAVDQLIKNLGQLGALTAILLAMGSVAVEKERGTAALVLSTPASRNAFLAAKAVALGATLAVGVAGAAIAAWLYTAILFEPLPVAGFAAAAVLLWLSLATYAALTFLGSTLTSSAIAAAGLGFALLIALGILGALPTIGEWLPSAIAATARALAVGSGTAGWQPIASTVVLIALALLGAAVSFRRQEL